MNFDRSVTPPLYEMGYWGQTLTRWHKEGMPKTQKFSYEGITRGRSFPGPLIGPDKEKPVAIDPGKVVKLDESGKRFPVENWIFPKFKPRILKRTDDTLIVVDGWGIKKKILQNGSSIPEYYEWPVKSRKDWEKLKEERLDSQTPGRYPSGMDKLISELKRRDYPLYIGGPPVGFFGSVRYLLGEVNLFTAYYDNQKLVKDIIDHLVNFWIELWSPILSQIQVDWVYIWEDMCYKTGPLISPQFFEEFMLPAYKKFTSFLKNNGVKNIFVDTDGNCWKLIPLFLEGGVTGLLPMEVAAGMNIAEVRKKFPKLQMTGGIDKRVLAKGKKQIDRELESKVPFVLKTGGYIPHVDHHVPPDVSLENFVYYRSRLEEMING